MDIQKSSGPKLTDFTKCIEQDWRVEALADEVRAFSEQFEMPGFDANDLWLKTLSYKFVFSI